MNFIFKYQKKKWVQENGKKVVKMTLVCMHCTAMHEQKLINMQDSNQTMYSMNSKRRLVYFKYIPVVIFS